MCIDQAKRGHCFDSTVRHFVCVCLSICVSHDYGCLYRLACNLESTYLVQNSCDIFVRYVFISLPLTNGDHFVGIFRRYGRRARFIVHREIYDLNSFEANLDIHYKRLVLRKKAVAECCHLVGALMSSTCFTS